MKPTLAVCAALLSVAALAAQQAQEIRVAPGTAPPGMVMAGGPPMAVGTGIVFGQITEGDSSRPVAGAIVSINLRGSQIRVMADTQGRFGFRDLPAGGFAISAVRPGWVDGSYGRTRPAGPTLPLVLAEGERVSGVVIPMWRYATIAGTVVDEAGDPLVNIPVRAMKRTTFGGRTRLTNATMDTTDDRGQYRIGSLEPGEYVVLIPLQAPAMDMPVMLNGEMLRDVAVVREVRERAVAAVGSAASAGNFFFMNDASASANAGVGEDGRPLAYTTVFYPNVAASTRATLISVSSGEERAAVDFQLKGVPIAKISGMVLGPEGPGNAQLTLVPSESEDNATQFETFTASADAQGRFTFNAVPPGQYTLRASRQPRPAGRGGGASDVQFIQQGGATMAIRTTMASGSGPLPTDPLLWAEMPLNVGGRDMPEVAVTLRPGAKMTGMLQFNGAAERPDPRGYGGVVLMLEPADPRPGVSNVRGVIDQGGLIQTVGMSPGRYFVRVLGSYPDWSLHSVMVGGRDATVVAIDVSTNDIGGAVLSFTDRPTKLTGQVTAEAGMAGVTVLVFPAESSAWVGYGSSSRRFSSARPDKNGAFSITNLPAGDYVAVAIPDKMANDWQNPKFLEALVPDGTRVRIQDAGTASANLRVVR